MKIALVFPAVNRSGGVERVIWEAARYMAAHHEVHLVATEVSDLPPGAIWHRVNAGRLASRPFTFARAASRALERIGPDVSVSYGSECPPGDVLVVGSVHRAWLALNAPIISGRRQWPGRLRYLMPSHLVTLWRERRYFGSSPKALAPCGDRVTLDLATFYNLKVPRTEVIYNGFDPALFSPGRAASLRKVVREELGLADETVALLMVANEWQRKGLGPLLDAVAQLRRERLALLLVGRQAPDAFSAKIAHLGLEEVVRYLGPTSDVARYHAAADLFVHPAQYEPFGLVLLEALASGLPVVTTRVPGAAFLVEDRVNGLLLDDPLDSVRLAQLLEEALDDEFRGRMAVRAAASVAGFDWASLMQRFEALVVGCAPARRPVGTPGGGPA